MTPLVLSVLSALRTEGETAPPAYTGDPNLVTPGVVGFIAIFLVAAATVLLLLDMTRRIRRTRYRAEVQEQLRAEQDEASGA